MSAKYRVETTSKAWLGDKITPQSLIFNLRLTLGDVTLKNLVANGLGLLVAYPFL